MNLLTDILCRFLKCHIGNIRLFPNTMEEYEELVNSPAFATNFHAGLPVSNDVCTLTPLVMLTNYPAPMGVGLVFSMSHYGQTFTYTLSVETLQKFGF